MMQREVHIVMTFYNIELCMAMIGLELDYDCRLTKKRWRRVRSGLALLLRCGG